MSGNDASQPASAGAYSCPHCGASVLSEVCQYCGTYVGNRVETQDRTAEYTMIRCKLAKFTFFGTIFPLIFMLSFTTMPAILTVAAMYDTFYEQSTSVYVFCIPFYLVGIGAGIVFFRNVWIIAANKLFGKVLDGTVYGYMDDTVAYNNRNGQQIKLLVYTGKSPEPYKFVLLPLADTSKPYAINSNVKVRLYKDTAKILRNRDDLNW